MRRLREYEWPSTLDDGRKVVTVANVSGHDYPENWLMPGGQRDVELHVWLEVMEGCSNDITSFVDEATLLKMEEKALMLDDENDWEMQNR